MSGIFSGVASFAPREDLVGRTSSKLAFELVPSSSYQTLAFIPRLGGFGKTNHT